MSGNDGVRGFGFEGCTISYEMSDLVDCEFGNEHGLCEGFCSHAPVKGKLGRTLEEEMHGSERNIICEELAEVICQDLRAFPQIPVRVVKVGKEGRRNTTSQRGSLVKTELK